jgi:phosphoglycolate phosphatase-like HAD superfamily hydrolase
MKFGMPEAIVFDLDGTLVNSMGEFAGIASEVMARHFKCDRKWAFQRYVQTCGLPFPFQLELIFPGDSRNRLAVENYNRAKREIYAKIPFFHDAGPALTWLRNRGVVLAVSSNNDYEVMLSKITGLGSTLFDYVAGFKPPAFLKGPSHFEWLSQQSGIRARKMIFVGDSLHDAVMARDCGLKFIAKLGTFSELDFRKQGIADRVIKNIFDLAELFSIPQSVLPAGGPAFPRSIPLDERGD